MASSADTVPIYEEFTLILDDEEAGPSSDNLHHNANCCIGFGRDPFGLQAYYDPTAERGLAYNIPTFRALGRRGRPRGW